MHREKAGVAEFLDVQDRTEAGTTPIHGGCAESRHTVALQFRAESGVEEGIGFEAMNGLGRGLKGRPTVCEDCPGLAHDSIEGAARRLEFGKLNAVGGSPVDQENRMYFGQRRKASLDQRDAASVPLIRSF
jgi:hypothetical protein